MTDEKMKKIFGNIPTKKYELIKNILISGTFASSALAYITPSVIDYALLLFCLLNCFSFLSMEKLRAVDFTKGYAELESEYNLFLSNYHTLMGTLDVDSYASLCTTFYYLYKNGYLSINGIFHDDEINCFEGRRYQLVNIFNGYGVCRHKANSLKDILNYCGYPTSSIPVYTRTGENFTQKEIENMKSYYEKMIKEAEGDAKTIEATVNVFLENEITIRNFEILNQASKTGVRERLKDHGNHLIVMSRVGSKKMIFDSTNNIFYQFEDQNNYNLVDEMGKIIEFRAKLLSYANTPSEEKILWNNLKLQPMNLEGLREDAEKTTNKLDENTDILENFRKDNQDLMRSLRNKAYNLI